MKFLLMLSLLLPSLALAANLKPGLWQVEMKMKQDGKFVDPMASMRKAMANMPESQRKQMMAMMREQGTGMGMMGNNLTACYTKEMLDENKLFAQNEASNCTSKILSKSAKSMKMSFNCNDGSRGEALWNIMSDSTYNGVVSMVNKDGKKSDLKYDMKFLNSDCGGVKPKM